MRALARAVWNTPVINGYAATEIGVLGQECEQIAGMHLAEDLFVIEVVDGRTVRCRPVYKARRSW